MPLVLLGYAEYALPICLGLGLIWFINIRSEDPGDFFVKLWTFGCVFSVWCVPSIAVVFLLHFATHMINPPVGVFLIATLAASGATWQIWRESQQRPPHDVPPPPVTAATRPIGEQLQGETSGTFSQPTVIQVGIDSPTSATSIAATAHAPAVEHFSSRTMNSALAESIKAQCRVRAKQS
jgi:hypothetical protein